MNLCAHNNNQIKLQGPASNVQPYEMWDLNHCRINFSGKMYHDMVSSIKEERALFYKGEVDLAVLDINEHNRDFKNYFKSLSKNVRRDAKSPPKKGFSFEKFDVNNYIYDFCEINKSFSLRMRVNKWFTQTAEALLNNGRVHSGRLHKWEDELHFSNWYGVFYNSKTGPKKLAAYCKVAIDGEMATINNLGGNPKFFKSGIMFYLLVNTIEQIFYNQSAQVITWYLWKDTSDWKARTLFKPAKVKLSL
jgi:hypothetical protein